MKKSRKQLTILIILLSLLNLNNTLSAKVYDIYSYEDLQTQSAQYKDNDVLNILGNIDVTSSMQNLFSNGGNYFVNGNNTNLFNGNLNYGFYIDQNTNLTLKNFKKSFDFLFNNFKGIDGSIYNNGILNLVSINAKNNMANNGGLVYNNGNLVVENSIFSSNSAVNGGVFYSLNSLGIKNSVFDSNIAQAQGAAVYTANNMNINNTLFSNNRSADSGGAVAITGGNLFVTVSDSNNENGDNNGFVNNYSEYKGGAISVNGVSATQPANLILKNVYLYNNTNNLKYNVDSLNGGGGSFREQLF